VVITNGGAGYENPVIAVITAPTTGVKAEVVISAKSANTTWARVVDVISDGLGVFDDNGNATGLASSGQGSIILNKSIPNTARIKRIFPAFNTIFSEAEKTMIIEQIANRNTFGLRFAPGSGEWKIVTAANLPASSLNNPDNFDLTYKGDDTSNNRDASWLLRVDYSANNWNIISRRHQFVFGSDAALRFHNQNSNRKFNVDTNKPERDKITISGINVGPDGSSYSLGRDINFFAHKYFTETNGYVDDTKLIVSLSDVDNDNYPDNPMAFRELTSTDTINISSKTENGFVYTSRSDEGEAVSGRKNLIFLWRRVSDSNFRIDPSLTNIIDIIVLNKNYDDKYRQWIAGSRASASAPAIPTITDLEQQFSEIISKKAVSDSIIYKSAEYKILFGSSADVALQGKFRVVPVTGTSYSNTEIKTKVLIAINDFFAIDNWDFGETFYFTELSAYIHQQCQGIVSSVIIIPTQTQSVFGDLFQITPKTHELLIPDVSAADIEIVSKLTIT
jgi:hypothetical protein